MIFDYNNALTRQEAISAIISKWRPPVESEDIDVSQACGRVLAQDLFAHFDLPVCRVSSFDGIAVRFADFQNGMPDTSAWTLGDQYAQADTGDDFPDRFDTVIAAENVSIDERGRLQLDDRIDLKKNNAVKPAGATVRSGELLCSRKTVLKPTDVALLTAGGYATIPVVSRLRVGFIPTGSELIPYGTPPARGQNIESNSVMVCSLLDEWDCESKAYDIVYDDKEALGAAIDQALAENDIVLINGGSSRGSEDYNSQLLNERASFFSHGVKSVPGRPIGIAVIDGKPALNIPGPMIATWLACDWLVRSLIEEYYGLPRLRRMETTVVLDETLHSPEKFEYLARLILSRRGGVLHAKTAGCGATLVENVRSVNAFLAIPPDTVLECGQEVHVELLNTRCPAFL